MLLGFDENGHCPMLIDNKCSIYKHRPRTCRAYDCRVFTATGLTTTDAEKELIAERVSRWRFSYPSEHDREVQAAVKDAAHFLREHADQFPEGFIPTASTQLAVLAVQVHDVFLSIGEAEGTNEKTPSHAEIVLAVMQTLTNESE